MPKISGPPLSDLPKISGPLPKISGPLPPINNERSLKLAVHRSVYAYDLLTPGLTISLCLCEYFLRLRLDAGRRTQLRLFLALAIQISFKHIDLPGHEFRLLCNVCLWWRNLLGKESVWYANHFLSSATPFLWRFHCSKLIYALTKLSQQSWDSISENIQIYVTYATNQSIVHGQV